MAKIKVTLTRFPFLHQYGPEEEKVFGIFDKVRLTCSVLRVWDKEKDANIGVYDDEIGAWRIFTDDRDMMWSDILLEVVES